MLAKVTSGALLGLDGTLVQVEVDITKKGFGQFRIVGLPSKGVDESKDRVKTAIENAGLEFPRYKVTVNLAPADLPKDSSIYDLPIAIGILTAIGQIQEEALEDLMICGELSLDSSIQQTHAILPLTLLAKQHKISTIIVPKENATESALVHGITVIGANSLKDVVLHLNSLVEISPTPETKIHDVELEKDHSKIVLDDIKGQQFAKRAMIIAAAGGHNLLFNGPPGAGKTLMAKALATLLPPLTYDESLTVTNIHSISSKLHPDSPIISHRPFRTPHHTISRVGLIGGGTQLTPGEISLAHHGVLFLDEIPEFPRSVLESLRQVMEDRIVTITRAKGTVTFPASFMLIASANPCPCGYSGSQLKDCTCNPHAVRKYEQKLSGPLLDRIDMHTYVKEVDPKELLDEGNSTDNEHTKARENILHARRMQTQRFKASPHIHTNAEMSNKELKTFCPLNDELKQLLLTAGTKLGLTARSMHKMIKIARTIADLDESNDIQIKHMQEALGYRQMKE